MSRPARRLACPVNQPAGIVQLEWCTSYAGPARACVHALKYDGELRLVEPLAEQLMAARWRRAGVGGDVLVPIPVHAARKRQRGFDQAELLARAVGRVSRSAGRDGHRARVADRRRSTSSAGARERQTWAERSSATSVTASSAARRVGHPGRRSDDDRRNVRRLRQGRLRGGRVGSICAGAGARALIALGLEPASATRRVAAACRRSACGS